MMKSNEHRNHAVVTISVTLMSRLRQKIIWQEFVSICFTYFSHSSDEKKRDGTTKRPRFLYSCSIERSWELQAGADYVLFHTCTVLSNVCFSCVLSAWFFCILSVLNRLTLTFARICRLWEIIVHSLSSCCFSNQVFRGKCRIMAYDFHRLSKTDVHHTHQRFSVDHEMIVADIHVKVTGLCLVDECHHLFYRRKCVIHILHFKHLPLVGFDIFILRLLSTKKNKIFLLFVVIF